MQSSWIRIISHQLLPTEWAFYINSICGNILHLNTWWIITYPGRQPSTSTFFRSSSSTASTSSSSTSSYSIYQIDCYCLIDADVREVHEQVRGGWKTVEESTLSLFIFNQILFNFILLNLPDRECECVYMYLIQRFMDWFENDLN